MTADSPVRDLGSVGQLVLESDDQCEPQLRRSSQVLRADIFQLILSNILHTTIIV